MQPTRQTQPTAAPLTQADLRAPFCDELAMPSRHQGQQSPTQDVRAELRISKPARLTAVAPIAPHANQPNKLVRLRHANPLPYVPVDIGLMVLADFELPLNPMVLLTLMDVEARNGIPSFLRYAAWSDRLWKPFSQMSLTKIKSNYAQAFIERWNARSQKDQLRLQQLWGGQLSPVWTLRAREDVCDDFDFVMAAVSQNSFALRYASASMRDERHIVITAVGQDGCALEYASEALQDEREIVMTAVCKTGWALQYASAALQGDCPIVMAAVRKTGWALQYVSAALQKERHIVMAAVSQNGRALQYACAALQDDRDIVVAAVRQYAGALVYASAAMRRDRAVAAATRN
jgi:hypothetical protein